MDSPSLNGKKKCKILLVSRLFSMKLTVDWMAIIQMKPFKVGINLVDNDSLYIFILSPALIFSTCGDPDLVSVFDKRKWRFWITGVLTFVTGIVGLLGNILSILTLSDK